MLRAQRIYGPHAVGHWDGGFVALGRSLFRLLPEDRFDRQPLAGPDGNTVLVADLRLDNRDDLMAVLGISPERGRNLGDAAILLAGLERWGENCLERIVGDFAFAFWDAKRRRLLLARDPMGQRPLHYFRGPNVFAFASMPKGLHALGEVPRGPDEVRMAEFVVLLPEQGPRTFFKDVERVEPGHVLTISAEGSVSRRYWEPVRRVIALKNSAEYDEGLRHHLEQATRARLRGAGERVGAHLSAGLDSSIVAATAARSLAPSRGRVVAFTGVPREGYDGGAPAGTFAFEDAHARLTAAMHPNIEHVVVRGGAGSPLDDLDRYFYLYEQPILNLCNGAWCNAINDAARERKLSVMLTGLMGNMTISYNGHEALTDLLARGRWLSWLGACAALVRSGHMGWKGTLTKSFGPYVPRSLWLWLNRTLRRRDLDVSSYTAINRERLEQLDLAAKAHERSLDMTYRPRKDAFATRLWVLRRVDLGNFNKGTLAGWGIDQRDPTADTRLVEYCLGVPAEQFMSGGVTRALARRAFADRVPAAVRNERRKGHQGADWHERLCAAKGQVSEEIARMEDCPAAARVLDIARLRGLAAAWPQTGWHTSEVVMSYRVALLRGLSTAHFLRMASGSNR